MLEALWLSPSQAELYSVLVRNPRCTQAELATYTNSSPQRTARDLAHLVRRGLADRLPGSQPRFVAVAPDLAIVPLISRLEEQLRQARTESDTLMEAFRDATRQSHPAELVEIITGADNIRSRTAQLQEATRIRLRGFDRPPYVAPASNNAREIQQLDEGITYQVIYSLEAASTPGRLQGDIRETVERGEQARVSRDLPLKLMIFDDRLALIPIKTGEHGIDAAFVVYPCDLFDALIALFDREWERAVPLRTFRPEPLLERSADPAEEVSRSVLSGLAAGMTDEGIAHAHGWSLRTAQRHIQRLMHDLGASSRFQAGMTARDRDWV